MTRIGDGSPAPLDYLAGLAARGHPITVFSPQQDSASRLPAHISVEPYPKNSLSPDDYDTVLFSGTVSPVPEFAYIKRKYLLMQDEDYLRLSSAERSRLHEGHADSQYHILSASRWLSKRIEEKRGGDRLTHIGLGVDTHRFFPDPTPRERFRILIHGRFNDPRGSDVDAIEVIARVRQHELVEIWAWGKRPPVPLKLIDRTLEDPLEDSIPRLYQRSHLFLKTSTVEGFCRLHLQAMACGCVPATYASGGVSDYCRHGENSLVTGGGNVPLMVGHVLDFLADATLRERLQANAIATARALPWAAAVDRLESALLSGMK